MRKYFSIFPLLLNTAMIYAGLPLIFRSGNNLFIEEAMAIIGLAALIGPSLLGLPVIIVRQFSRGEPFPQRFRLLLVSSLILSLTISAAFLLSVKAQFLWLLLFWPPAVANILVCSYLEANRRFFASYLFRAVYVSIMPLILIFGLYEGSVAILSGAVAAGLVSFVLNARTLARRISIGPDNHGSYAEFLPPFFAYVSTFLFIFFDRFVVGFASDATTTAAFIKESEQVYRLIAPILFITALNFPAMAARDESHRNHAYRELRIINMIWFAVAAVAPAVCSILYTQFHLPQEEAFFWSAAPLISIFMALMGVITGFHRHLLASDDQPYAIRYFVSSLIAVSLGGAMVSHAFHDAPLTYLTKALIEGLFVLVFWLSAKRPSRKPHRDMPQ